MFEAHAFLAVFTVQVLAMSVLYPARFSKHVRMQATSLPFIVAATQIGVELGAISEQNSAALIGAGLLSVIVFPITALGLLKGMATSPESQAEPPA